MSSPAPPSSVSAAAPPFSRLPPASPVSQLAAVAEPTRFSMPESVSPAASPPDWAAALDRFTVTPPVEAE
ncbi:hypothetical protein SLNSH_24030 [Alsobacter soli]|uniref:Uncharacterized protein n=1 Tax=Alsobacter soli TaxID=2109933 RepID=A0A2T1HLD1_9HYPH|nr:hypothetical protein SLNSH_24030 [Alsobacter soli]